VVKWNCVFRQANPEHGLRPGDYKFKTFVVFGDRAMVENALRALHEEFAPAGK
jgi:hypothetical protein